jgi:hypothetical protein
LACRDCVDATADGLADEGGGVDDEPADGKAVIALVDPDLRESEGDEEQYDGERAVSDERDIGGARPPQRWDGRDTEGGEHRAEQQRARPGPEADAKRLDEAEPVEVEVIDDDAHRCRT